MTEAELTEAIIALAEEELGLLAHWNPDSRRVRGRKGFPDLVIAGVGGVLFAEVKTGGGETSPDQDLWRWTLHEADQRHVIWRASDWEAGSVRRTLEVLAALRSSVR
jgi:hypothetical protein